MASKLEYGHNLALSLITLHLCNKPQSRLLPSWAATSFSRITTNRWLNPSQQTSQAAHLGIELRPTMNSQSRSHVWSKSGLLSCYQEIAKSLLPFCSCLQNCESKPFVFYSRMEKPLIVPANLSVMKPRNRKTRRNCSMLDLPSPPKFLALVSNYLKRAIQSCTRKILRPYSMDPT